MSQVQFDGQQPFFQQPINPQPEDDVQPLVQHQKQHAPDVHMEKLTADDLKAIMSGNADMTAA
ncbi:MAG: hypothetical protein ACQGQP_04370, partial [Desulfovibrio sp.]